MFTNLEKPFSLNQICLCYRPQCSCGKVIFSPASVILSMGGVSQHALGQTPLWADTPSLGRHPLSRHPPLRQTPQQTPPPGQTPSPWTDTPHQADTPLWADTPSGQTPPAQCMLGYTPPCPAHAGIHTPTPLRTVRILLECILVLMICLGCFVLDFCFCFSLGTERWRSKCL